VSIKKMDMQINFRKYGIYFMLVMSLLTGILPAQTENSVILYSVSVVGAVKNPGVYRVPPISRISDVINLANRNMITKIDTLNLTETKQEYSLRNILLSRNEEQIQIDLAKFFINGNDTNNPYLRDGDVVFIPAKKKSATINGAVSKPGTFELKDGDKLSDIIEFALGVTEDVYKEAVEITRFNNNEQEVLNIDLNQVLLNPDSKENIFIENDDIIYVRSIPEFHKSKEIELMGEVQFPGKYSIRENQTTLLEILTKAGGPTDFADLKNSILQRVSEEDIIDPEFERLKTIPVSSMNSLEYEYFKTKSRELKGRFAVDFENLWQDKNTGHDVVLKETDFIFIPGKNVTVAVSGQVKNPGLTAFVPGQNFEYYIEQAGGLSWNARKRKIRIIKANTGEWLKPNESVIIEIGDQIFVPEKPEIKYWIIAKEVITTLAQVATLIVVVQSITAN
jgi:protein involved in polysaccharide export with SLBB domain